MTQQQIRILLAALVVAALLLMISITANGDLGGPRGDRGMSAATLYGAIIAGTFTLLGVVVERLVRRIGRVECLIEEGDWSMRNRSGGVVQERALAVAFVNRKDVPVTVWKMHIDFSKGGEPIADAEWARPKLLLGGSDAPPGAPQPVGPVNLPPHMPVTLLLIMSPGREDIIRELGTADRAEFVATLIGAPDKREELHPAWDE